jgi:hypothetical protein
VRLYGWAFAAKPALADDLNAGHRYNAVCIALRAAAGRDEEMTTFGFEEWGYLTGLAQTWLRADLGLMSTQAKDTKKWPEVRQRLLRWKAVADMAIVREPSRRATMPPADQEAWASLWTEVDTLFAGVTPRATPR